MALNLNLPRDAVPHEQLKTVWVEYSDPERIGTWRDTWDFGSQGQFLLSDSRLVR